MHRGRSGNKLTAPQHSALQLHASVMLRAWQRRRRRTHVCHFCSTQSMLVPPYGDADANVRTAGDTRLSSGTPERWFCSACESWNHTDGRGHILDLYERPMWDASLHSTQYATKHDIARDLIFCRTCLANQTLVTNLLASYLGDEGDADDDAERIRAFPEYKRSLEERYPLACKTCSERAQAHIQQLDGQIQSTNLAAWLTRAPNQDPNTEVPRFWVWHIMRAETVVAHVLGICIPLVSQSWLACLPPCTFDPCWPRIHAYRARKIRTYSHGWWAWMVRRQFLRRPPIYLYGHTGYGST